MDVLCVWRIHRSTIDHTAVAAASVPSTSLLQAQVIILTVVCFCLLFLGSRVCFRCPCCYPHSLALHYSQMQVLALARLPTALSIALAHVTGIDEATLRAVLPPPPSSFMQSPALAEEPINDVGPVIATLLFTHPQRVLARLLCSELLTMRARASPLALLDDAAGRDLPWAVCVAARWANAPLPPLTRTEAAAAVASVGIRLSDAVLSPSAAAAAAAADKGFVVIPPPHRHVLPRNQQQHNRRSPATVILMTTATAIAMREHLLATTYALRALLCAVEMGRMLTLCSEAVLGTAAARNTCDTCAHPDRLIR